MDDEGVFDDFDTCIDPVVLTDGFVTSGLTVDEKDIVMLRDGEGGGVICVVFDTLAPSGDWDSVGDELLLSDIDIAGENDAETVRVNDGDKLFVCDNLSVSVDVLLRGDVLLCVDVSLRVTDKLAGLDDEYETLPSSCDCDAV
jgi:hypothetical protein